ncbi:MAG: hypothetical protein NTW29_10345 [Bacteroidetes bacterium]|nr:hypothetical protein [Bacteroidota bacterium]
MIRKVVSSLLLIQFLCCAPLPVPAQSNEKIMVPAADTVAPPDTSSITTPLPLSDTAAIRQQVITGMDTIIRLQEENNRKKKNQAYIRIGIGVMMLIVLILGFMRKKKG